MKKLLALVLALVMTLSLAVVGSNAAFKDAEKVNETYAEAVDVLAGMKVFQGYTDGTFQPTGDITRAEVAAIVYRLYTADVTDAQASLYATYNKFNDMDGAKWAAGYIGYCGNAGLIKGYDAKTFGPSDKVTGYQALAMILRAVGYDAQGEFTGADWQLHVAQTAQQAGVLQNVKGVDLNAAATRELVAELLFRTAAEVPMVKYTPAFGYVANSVVGAQKTLGEKNFGLKLTNGTADVWGRPSHTWTYTTGNKKTVVAQAADATYTTKISECDIAKDLGITTSVALEKAFIDGVPKTLTDRDVTSNQYASINPLATASLVGAQGRITEAYVMADGKIRLVEINTYLAQVTKVTAAYTDPNGHVIDATIDLSVYDAAKDTSTGLMNKTADWTFKGVEATGFTKDQYVLVTISNPGSAVAPKAKVQSVEAANVVAGGAIAGWTNAVGVTAATTVIGTTTYKDADKFEKNYRPTTGNWMVALDKYENVIGLVESAVNYLVIEKIEWKASPNSIGGFASADLVLANGEKVSYATIATINGLSASNRGDSFGDCTAGTVSDFYYNNGNTPNGYYGHIFTYSVNENGSYNIKKHETPTSANRFFDVTSTGTVTKGVATINAGVNTYVATNNTVFMLLNADGYTYTVYTGKNNVPSVRNADLCIMTDANGYATLVVIKGQLSSNTFYAYVTEKDANGRFFSDTKGWQYTIYKAGETTPTTIYGAKNTLAQMMPAGTTWHGTGLYEFVVNSNGQIDTVTSVNPVLCDTHCGFSWTNVSNWDRVAVKAVVNGESFQAQGYSAITAATAEDADNGYSVTAAAKVRDYNVITEGDNATKFVVVTKANANSDAVLTAGTMDDLTKNSIVLVNYTATAADNGQTNYTAKTVYILKFATADINTPATTGSIHYTVNVLNRITGAVEPTMTRDFTSTGLVAKTYTTADYPANWILTNVGYDAAQYSVSTCTPSVVVTAGNTAEVVLTVYHN